MMLLLNFILIVGSAWALLLFLYLLRGVSDDIDRDDFYNKG